MSTDRAALPLCVDVLGPLALRVDGAPVEVPGRQRRALLALLALGRGRAVGVDQLIDALWEDNPPDNADQALYNHVSRLRAHLRPYGDRLERVPSGYRLRLDRDELDVDAARRRADSDPHGALALWRGPALAEFRTVPALELECVALDELRLRLVDDLVEERLAAGDRSATVDARAAAAASPLRERTALLLVRALAADGRAAEAMAEATAYRHRLADETGLDPGPELAVLEQQVASGTLGGPRQRAVVARPDGPMVGRQHDREEVLRLIAVNGTVTVTGPGGVGKTRLALDVAADPATGARETAVVDLAAVDRADRVCAAVASTLGLRTTGSPGPVEIASALADRDLLLVLDNCEHVTGACRELVATVRRQAARVRVLATSRVTLHVPGEYVVRLQPLPIPRETADLAALRRQPGVRAFLEHARRRHPGYDVTEADVPDLVEVLRRLDGLPLGIELAARQVAVMPLHAVRERLDSALDLGTEARQSTLRATIASSYGALSGPDQALLRSIAPFPGGVDLAGVEALADDPIATLHHLVDASLLVADPLTGRYRLLFTVRTFLLDELRSRGELAAAEERFLDRCLAVVAEIVAEAFGPQEPRADRRLRAELDNLRAARDVARAHRRDDVRIGITTALDEVATWRDLRELWAWALELAEEPSLAAHPARPRVLGAAAEAARLVGDLDGAERLAGELLALVEARADPEAEERAWSALGSVAHFRGDFSGASAAWLRASESGTPTAGSLVACAALAEAYGGRAAAARALLDRAHGVIAGAPCDSHLAFAAYVEGELRANTNIEESIPFYLEAIATARRCGATFVEGVARVALASAHTRTGDVAAAADGFGYLLDAWHRTGQTTQLWTTARNAAGLLAAVGGTYTAALVLVCADQQPGAAAVSPAIARYSGRLYLPLGDLVTPEQVDGLSAEVGRLTPAGVLDLLRRDLAALL